MVEFTVVNELRRTYMWADGGSFVVENVVGFAKPGSTHRLKDKDGNLYIVKPDWRIVRIEGPEEFSF